jgi:hypothetical protein
MSKIEDSGNEIQRFSFKEDFLCWISFSGIFGLFVVESLTKA